MWMNVFKEHIDVIKMLHALILLEQKIVITALVILDTLEMDSCVLVSTKFQWITQCYILFVL